MLRRPASSTLFPYTTLFRSRARGIRTIAVSAGYMNPAARRDFFRHMDAANIDLKAFSDAFYEKVTFAKLPVVLETLEYLRQDRKSTRLNSSHVEISYAVFCLNATATRELYTLSLHDALPISGAGDPDHRGVGRIHEPGGPAGLLPAHGRGQHRPQGVLRRVLREGHLRQAAGRAGDPGIPAARSEEHTSELQSRRDLVCRLLLECYGDPRALHSFPTRRSSDLGRGGSGPSRCRPDT